MGEKRLPREGPVWGFFPSGLFVLGEVSAFPPHSPQSVNDEYLDSFHPAPAPLVKRTSGFFLHFHPCSWHLSGFPLALLSLSEASLLSFAVCLSQTPLSRALCPAILFLFLPTCPPPLYFLKVPSLGLICLPSPGKGRQVRCPVPPRGWRCGELGGRLSSLAA